MYLGSPHNGGLRALSILLFVLSAAGAAAAEEEARLDTPSQAAATIAPEKSTGGTPVDPATGDAPQTPDVSAPPADGDAAASSGGEEDPEDARINAKVAEALAAKIDEEFPVKASYGSKGFRLETRDGNWQTNLQWRAQFRFSWPFVGDPRQVDDFEATKKANFEARRLRMKIGGHGYRPWLKYYFELDLEPSRDTDDSSSSSSTRVIDWRVDVAKWEKLGLRVGQWKIDYNRERVDSSGRQQFVERSIVNRIFTIDRQVGVQLKGRLFKGTPADFLYYGGVFTGEGRGVTNDDDKLLYVGRLQWNFLGRDVALRQTDVERTELPSAALGAGGAFYKGKCTRWSSSGCGNLDGFQGPADARDNQFRIQQMAQDFAFKWQGFSIQEEFHWKRVHDQRFDTENDLLGSYAQAGYFFNEILDVVPEPLEVAFRYGWVREPNETNKSFDNKRQEFTAGLNWFFAGHNNKLTLDYSYLTLDDTVANRKPTANRVRFQWDVSF